MHTVHVARAQIIYLKVRELSRGNTKVGVMNGVKCCHSFLYILILQSDTIELSYLGLVLGDYKV